MFSTWALGKDTKLPNPIKPREYPLPEGPRSIPSTLYNPFSRPNKSYLPEEFVPATDPAYRHLSNSKDGPKVHYEYRTIYNTLSYL